MTPCRIAVRSYELDSFGHVNNAVFLNYLETARSYWLDDMGLSFESIAAAGVQIVIARVEIEYRIPLRSRDTVVVNGNLSDYGPASIVWNYRLERESDGAVVAVAKTTGVCIDPRSGKPKRWVEPFATAFSGAVAPRIP